MKVVEVAGLQLQAARAVAEPEPEQKVLGGDIPWLGAADHPLAGAGSGEGDAVITKF